MGVGVSVSVSVGVSVQAVRGSMFYHRGSGDVPSACSRPPEPTTRTLFEAWTVKAFRLHDLDVVRTARFRDAPVSERATGILTVSDCRRGGGTNE